MRILALDLGKSKMLGCVYDSQTHEHRFDGAPLDKGTLGGVLDVERPDRVVIEVDPSAGWIGDVIRQAGIELQVANPNHEGWRWRNVKRKMDRLDALKLAQLSVSDQLPQVQTRMATASCDGHRAVSLGTVCGYTLQLRDRGSEVGAPP